MVSTGFLRASSHAIRSFFARWRDYCDYLNSPGNHTGNMSHTLSTVLLACTFLAAVPAADGGIDQARAEFQNPAAGFRAKPLNQRAYPDGAAMATDLAAGRWGGVNAGYPDGFKDYLHDPEGWKRYLSWMEAIQQQGLTAWIYDERGYPSGRAGGLVLKARPDLEAQALFHTTTFVNTAVKPKQKDDPIGIAPTVWKLPEGKPFLVVAYPLAQNALDVEGEAIDVTAAVVDGTLRTTLPATEWNNWRLHAFVQNRLYDGTHAPLTGGPMPNIIDPEAVRLFIEATHGEFYRRCQPYFGKTITATFTDEVSLNTGFLSDAVQPHAAVAWYHGLPELFRQRTGRDIRACLPALFDDAIPNAAALRCAFYDLLGEQVASSYYKQVREWCAAHGIISTGHLLWEESLIYHAHFYGNAFPSLRELDWPGIDVLWCKYGQAAGSHTDGGAVTPKLASSAAHLWGRARTMSESFWDTKRALVPIDHVIEHYAWQAVMGINTLTTITVQDQYPADELARFNDTVGRLNAALTQGRFTADVALLYPIASVQAAFKPTNRHVHFHDDNPVAAEVDRAWRRATEVTLASQRDFDYLDEEVLAAATIEPGRLVFGGNQYAVLVLPHVTTMRLASLRKLAEFTAAGGTVITYRTTPSQRADAGPATEFNTLADSLWGGSNSRAIHAATDAALSRVLKTSGIPSLSLHPANSEVNYQHRILADGDLFYVLNTGLEPMSGDFTFRAAGRAEVWNPFDGTTLPVESTNSGAHSTLNLSLPPRRGVMVVFRRTSP